MYTIKYYANYYNDKDFFAEFITHATSKAKARSTVSDLKKLGFDRILVLNLNRKDFSRQVVEELCVGY